MIWASFWVGVAAIPAAVIASALVTLAAYWALKYSVIFYGQSKRYFKVNPKANREGLAAKILATDGRSIYADFGPLSVVLQVGEPWLRGQDVWDMRHKLEELVREEKKEGGKYL